MSIGSAVYNANKKQNNLNNQQNTFNIPQNNFNVPQNNFSNQYYQQQSTQFNQMNMQFSIQSMQMNDFNAYMANLTGQSNSNANANNNNFTFASKFDLEFNLFDENNWGFVTDAVDNRVQNYEYFVDLSDVSAVSTSYNNAKNIILYFTLTLLLFITISGGIIGFRYITRNDVAYNSVANAEEKVEYIEGNELSNEDIISTSKLLNKYFSILNSGTNYEELDNLCVDKSSFKKYYDNYLSNIKENYDMNDCYARALKMIGVTSEIDKIDKVIEKDGTEYCYVHLKIPNEEDINNYVYLYKYNMIKYFQSHQITEENMLLFFVTNMADNPITSTAKNYCVKMKKQDDGSYLIVDDMPITTTCVSAFTNIVSKMSALLGGVDFN